MGAVLDRVDVVDGQVPLPDMPEPVAPRDTAARLDHVLAAIDGALEDWAVSDDAMRWSPDPENAVAVDDADWDDDEEMRPPPWSKPPTWWDGTPLEFNGNRLLEFSGPRGAA